MKTFRMILSFIVSAVVVFAIVLGVPALVTAFYNVVMTRIIDTETITYLEGFFSTAMIVTFGVTLTSLQEENLWQ